jgi:predicted Zn-dependent protease
MRFIPAHLPLAVILLGVALPAFAQDSVAPTAPDPIAQQTGQILMEAGTLLRNGDLVGARKKVDEAIALLPENEEVMSMNAAILTYEKNIPEARAVYLKLQQKAPQSFSVNWNLAELDFLEGSFVSSRERLEKLRQDRPKDEMLTYKVMLTYLFDGKLDKAQAELDKIPFPSDTAAYYYGRAAIDFFKNNPTEALGWVAEAGRIFRLSQTFLFADALIEKGYLKREQITGLNTP